MGTVVGKVHSSPVGVENRQLTVESCLQWRSDELAGGETGLAVGQIRPSPLVVIVTTTIQAWKYHDRLVRTVVLTDYNPSDALW